MATGELGSQCHQTWLTLAVDMPSSALSASRSYLSGSAGQSVTDGFGESRGPELGFGIGVSLMSFHNHKVELAGSRATESSPLTHPAVQIPDAKQ